MTERHGHNAQYSFNRVLELLLLVVFSDDRKPHFRRPCLQLDNCRVHRLKASNDFLLKMLLFEYPIRLTVITWHHLTSGFSGT
jgi:hypothetical protein